MIQALIKTYWRIFLLKHGPENIPYSRVLLVAVIALYFVVGYLVNTIWLGATSLDAFIRFSVDTAVRVFLNYILIDGVLRYLNLANRLVQVLSGVFGADLFFDLLRLSIIPFWLLLDLNILALITIVLTYLWQVVVFVFIFFRSFDIEIFIAGLLVFFYMLIIYNIEYLISNFL